MAWRALAPERTHSSSSSSRLARLASLAPSTLRRVGLRLQVGGVVALVGVGPAAVELEDPLGHVVQEVPVVGDGDDGAGVLLQVLLQPRDALGVEVVGRLVEQQQVGRLEQQLAQRDAAALTTGEHGDVGVAGRAAQRVHRLLDAGVELPAVGVLDHLHELALLGQQRVEVGVGLAHRRADLLEAGQRVAQSATASSTLPRTSSSSFSGGSCWSMPTVAPGASVASPLEALLQAGHDLQDASTCRRRWGRRRRSWRRAGTTG